MRALPDARPALRPHNRTEVELREASPLGEGQAVLRGIASRPQQPGLYIYLPTLALLISQLGVSALAFAGLILLAILGFTRVWLAAATSSSYCSAPRSRRRACCGRGQRRSPRRSSR
jgi:hypothetical protein